MRQPCFFTVLTAKQAEGVTDQQCALATASFAAWPLLGVWMAPHVLRYWPAGWVLLVGTTVSAALLGMVLLPMLWWGWVTMIGVMSMCWEPGNSAISAYMITATPALVQGRMSATFLLLNTAPVPIGVMIAGVLLQRYGFTAAITPLVLVFIAAVLLLVSDPWLRALPRTDQFDTLPPLPDPAYSPLGR